VQSLGEGACALLAPDRIANRHLFEREDHTVARLLLDPEGALGDLFEAAGPEEASKLGRRQRGLPALVGRHFIFPLPREIRRIAESAGEEAQELAAAADRWGQRHPTSLQKEDQHRRAPEPERGDFAHHAL